MKKNALISSNLFGPQLEKIKQLSINKQVRKLIHYDCENDLDEDIPNEDEIYIKENLLNKNSESNGDQGDDLSIVNINVSILCSSSGNENSNSLKNSVSLTYSSDSKKLNSNSSSSSKSKDSPSETVNFTNKIKEIIENKRKAVLDKQILNKTKTMSLSLNKKILSTIYIENNSQIKEGTSNNNQSSNDLIDVMKDLDTLQNKTISNSHLDLKNININLDTKSFDINPSNDNMLRDIKALHLITKKALSAQTKYHPIDSIDDERRSFYNFQSVHSKKALFINDNSDLQSGAKGIPLVTNSLNNMERNPTSFKLNNIERSGKARSQIINIININNNYNIGTINMPAIDEKFSYSYFNNHFSINSVQNSTQTKKSFKTVNIKNYKKSISQISLNQLNTNNDFSRDTNSNLNNSANKKIIPVDSHNNPKNIKDIIKTFKNQKKKEKFISLAH